MGFAFEVSAPGKVILHGEHSVVYGKPAIAGVVQVRNRLTLREQTGCNKIEVYFKKLGLEFQFNLEDLQHFLSALPQEYETLDLPKGLNHETFYEKVKAFAMEKVQASSMGDRQLNSIISFVYLLAGIMIKRKQPVRKAFRVDLETAMSIGAGLGSSASFGVCLAGAFVVLTGLHENGEFLSNFNSGSVDRKAVLEEISDWAFCSEKIMHGNPSGLDNTICTFGDVVKFYRGQPPEPISLACPIPILLIDSNVSRSTATLVQKVVQLRQQHPLVVERIFDAMGYLVEDAVAILKSITSQDSEKFKKLETLVAMNNNLLRAIDVSHPELEKIFAAAERHGFKAKLSGAGGGGFAMIVLGPEGERLTQGYENLKRDLAEQKFDLIETNLGGVGFQAEELRS